MKVYYALIHKDADSAYGITFPDLPGCFGAADAETDVHEAGQTALTLYAQDEVGLPPPRTLSEIQADRFVKTELARGAVLLAVPLIVVERKARYNVMLDVDLVAGVDREARMMGISRSEFLTHTVRDHFKTRAGVAVTGGPSITSAENRVSDLGSKTATKAAKSAAALALTQAAPAKKAGAKTA